MATYRQGHPEPRGQGRWPPAGGAGQRPAPSPAGPLWPRLCRPGSDRRRAGAPAPAAGTGQAKPSCPALLGRYPMDPSEAGQRERNPGLWEGLQIHWRPGAGPGGAPSPEELPEWLVTNGLGGFACGTVPGLPTRRYHGWLVAAVAPPVDRRLLWAATADRGGSVVWGVGLRTMGRPGAGRGGAPPPGELPEGLVTNGLGGFACGTVPGLPTRRYHGWLVAAVAPPVDRRLLWAATEEWVRT